METVLQAVDLFEKSRVIGNSVTGPTINTGFSGWIGGTCAASDANPTGDTANCSGHKIYGNEVFNFGKIDGSVDEFHHLYYISNRSTNLAEAYEIAWNYHHDNPIFAGIHVYDNTPCGGWTGVIKIHHNVVQNQGGNAVNINVNCSETLDVDIHDNLIITDTDYNLSGLSAPASAIVISNLAEGVYRVYNNTIFGYGSSARLEETGMEFINNIIVDNRGLDYVAHTYKPPSRQGSNIFYSTVNPSLPLPFWASPDAGNIIADPLFRSPESGNLLLQKDSPALGNGDDRVIGLTPRDFHGRPRSEDAVNIGAMGLSVEVPNPPTGLKTVP